MMLPDYWLQRPSMEIDEATNSKINRLFTEITADGKITRINYTFPFPKWQFLCHLADQYGVILHGTGDTGIRVFEPRLSIDLSEFGAQKAVYAAGDGLWAMFFAILDRDKHPMATSNACIRLVDESGAVSEPQYVFSISQPALEKKPWRNGTVYLLPGDTFVQQPSMRFGTYEVRIPQLASLVPVVPFAQLEVSPADFPLLEEIRGLDDTRLEEYGHAMQTGAPWPGQAG